MDFDQVEMDELESDYELDTDSDFDSDSEEGYIEHDSDDIHELKEFCGALNKQNDELKKQIILNKMVKEMLRTSIQGLKQRQAMASTHPAEER